MSSNNNLDLKFIKKNYGEKFMHLCRRLFPTILVNEGELSQIIFSHFAPTKNLFEDLMGYEDEFQEFIYDIYKEKHFISFVETDKSPYELMDEAGYILYPECKTEDEIQSFKKYYASNEQLCTFVTHRLNTCRVWFAVKKNVDSIKRENFTHPLRQDEYGTSVISIQFTKLGNHLSIKNRYNHAVKANNCDSTFNNNLDNIIEGLTFSFKHYFDLKDIIGHQGNTLKLKDYVAVQNRLYKVNNIFDKTYKFEKYNLYFCENNIIIKDGEVIKYDNDRYLLIDNYLFDMKNKTIKTFDYHLNKPVEDSFIKSIGKIKDMKLSKTNDGKIVKITTVNNKEVIVRSNLSNQLIGYENKGVAIVGGKFLSNNEHLKEISLPNLVFAGNYFLENCTHLDELYLPKLIKLKDFSLRNCEMLKTLSVPNVVSAGYGVLQHNQFLSSLYMPNVKKVGDMFLTSNMTMAKLDMPKLKSVGHCFMSDNFVLNTVFMPKLISIKNNFLTNNANIVYGSPLIVMPKKTIFAQNTNSKAYNEKYNNIHIKERENVQSEQSQVNTSC